ncbi:hypothetical protein ACQ4PT_070602 [Festuca glaucescens]
MGTSGSKGMDGVGGIGGAALSGDGGIDGDEGSSGAGRAVMGSWHGGAQLYVSLKMEKARIIGDLVPHVYGSEPIIGSWDPAHALAMERELASMWELSFVVPPDHETLDFKFLLKPKDAATPCIIEEGPTRLLTGGMLEGDVRLANFRINGDDDLHEFRVFNKADIVSPLDLAASWRVYKENFQPSMVRGIPDVSINEAPAHATEDGSGSSLELDLEHYVVPTPTAPPTEYAANLAATPASLIQPRALWTNDILLSDGIQSKLPDSFLFLTYLKAMPEAAGAVAAAAVADRLHGSKEDRKLAIVLVGLPARGKTFTAVKLTRYLRWLGHETKHFNVGKSADFFRPDNQEGIEARNEVAALAMEDMIDWMHGGGQVGIFDATNSTSKRRYMLMKMAEGNCKIIFLETICNDRNIIERNIWTSTLQRTILTATPIVGFPKIQWRALDEINSGVCDGMTYEEIKKIMPEEYESRKKDKLRYRYPRGESYLDVIQRLEPVIIELERQRAPVVVISHQAVLRALYSYFADRPLREVPDMEMPLHTIIEIQMGVTGVEEKRYKLMD